MKFSQALAEDVPLVIGASWKESVPIAYAWELKKGGLAFFFGGFDVSPSAEAHVVEGTIEGEGPWTLTSNDGEMRLEITPVGQHLQPRGDREGALNYLAFWFDRLRRADLVL